MWFATWVGVDPAVAIPALASRLAEIKEDGDVTRAVVSLSGDTLFLDLDHEGPLQLVPISDTSFSESGDVIQFVQDGQGRVTAFLYVKVEGERRAVRVR